jgi:outer membrane protein OmpA-like peptidoglycan-associated protein
MGLALVLAFMVTAGCKASLTGSATGSVDAGASASAEGVVAPAAPIELSSRMRYVGDELEYEGTISFKTDSAELDGDETFEILADLRQVLREHPEVEVAIEGHTDSRASAHHNRALSQRRADAVSDWLAAEGVESDRLDAAGFGEDDPQVLEPPECVDPPENKRDDLECEDRYWKHNRRVVFRVTAGGETLAAQRPGPRPELPTPAQDEDEKRETPRLRAGALIYAGPGLAVFSQNYQNALDRIDGVLDADAVSLGKFQMFAGGGYLWLPSKRFLVAMTFDIETSPLAPPAGVHGWNTRLGPTLRLGAHGRRWMVYGRISPGIQADRLGASFTLAPNVGAIGLITRRFGMGVETGPDFDNTFRYTHADAKLLFVWFFGPRAAASSP